MKFLQNDTETKKRKLKREISKLKKNINSLEEKKDEAYRRVQDFRVDAVTTDNAIKAMKAFNTEIKRENTNLKKKQKELNQLTIE